MRIMTSFRINMAGPMLATLLLVVTLTALTGCNTTAGVGQDVSATGRAVTNSAEKVKQGL